MPEIKIVKMSLLSDEGNKRNCWSAVRQLDKCYQCEKYPTCDSKIVNKEYDEVLTLLQKDRDALAKRFKLFHELTDLGKW